MTEESVQIQGLFGTEWVDIAVYSMRHGVSFLHDLLCGLHAATIDMGIIWRTIPL